jgi:iron complex transport system ATP-binding protein
MKLTNLHIGYSTTLLEIQELNLEAGKIYALIGANGRGKTTLMKTLIGQIHAISGEMKIDNKAASLLTPIEKSKLFGFVQSRFSGVPYMKAKEYVALGRSPYTNAFGRLSAKDEEIVNQSFSTLEITHLADKFTEELSDGERQMLAIAKVLTQETHYIFLDEPTAFLDYSNKKRVLEKLIEISKKLNKVIVYSSHDLELALNYSNELICLPQAEHKMKCFMKKDIDFNKLVKFCFG